MFRNPLLWAVILTGMLVVGGPAMHARAASQTTAAVDAAAGDAGFGDVGSSKENDAAQQKLDRMSAGEIQELDRLLAAALELYYDRQFAEAYPLFRQIAAKVDTMDVMYWLAVSAAAVGENDVAIDNFRKILSIDPQLHHVRARLATAYVAQARYEEARRELQAIDLESLPPVLRQRVIRLAQALEPSERKVSWNLRLSQGVMYNDNVSASAGRGEYEVEAGTLIASRSNRQIKDWAAVSGVAGNVLYDFGANNGLLWNTALSFYNRAYFDFSEFNFMQVDLSTGPWWADSMGILKAPFGYTELRFGNDELGHALHVDPSYQYNFNEYFSLRGLYTFSAVDYDARRRSELEYHVHRFELQPFIYLAERSHVIAPAVGYQNHNADAGKYSYDGPYAALSYLARFPTRTNLLLRYQWSQRRYDSPALPFYSRRRDDDRQDFTAAVRQGIIDGFFAAFSFTYTDNDSNLEIYDFDRATYTLSIEYRF
jgi:hypothetical protein